MSRRSRSSRTRRCIIELEKSWNEAFYSKDLKFIESILADEFIVDLRGREPGRQEEGTRDHGGFRSAGRRGGSGRLHRQDLRRHRRRLVHPSPGRHQAGTALRADAELHRRVGAPRRQLAVRLGPQHARHLQVTAGNPVTRALFPNNSQWPAVCSSSSAAWRAVCFLEFAEFLQFVSFWRYQYAAR